MYAQNKTMWQTAVYEQVLVLFLLVVLRPFGTDYSFFLFLFERSERIARSFCSCSNEFLYIDNFMTLKPVSKLVCLFGHLRNRT